MPERTSSSEEIDRETVAERLEDVATEFRQAEDVRVRVGNKDVELRPSETLTYEIAVVERNSFLRGNREAVEIELRWKPRSGDS